MSNDAMRMLGLALAVYGLSACADTGTQDDTQEPQESVPELGQSEQALSRCGAVPRRPWPSGCHYTCACTGAVNGPYGEDPGDYSCTGFPGVTIDGRPGGECHLRSRGDCAFELICADD
jgi:hypothetical protein